MKIQIERTTLLDTVRANREKHREIFLKAQQGYQKQIVQLLEERLQRARDGKQVQLWINLTEPMDQTNDYDRIIRMLEMTETHQIELSEGDFSQYVMDDWQWKKQFLATNSSYMSIDPDN
jgi:hypothetical protein